MPTVSWEPMLSFSPTRGSERASVFTSKGGMTRRCGSFPAAMTWGPCSQPHIWSVAQQTPSGDGPHALPLLHRSVQPSIRPTVPSSPSRGKRKHTHTFKVLRRAVAVHVVSPHPHASHYVGAHEGKKKKKKRTSSYSFSPYGVFLGMALVHLLEFLFFLFCFGRPAGFCD